MTMNEKRAMKDLERLAGWTVHDLLNDPDDAAFFLQRVKNVYAALRSPSPVTPDADPHWNEAKIANGGLRLVCLRIPLPPAASAIL